MRQTRGLVLVAVSTVMAAGGCDALEQTIAELTAELTTQITEAITAEEQAVADEAATSDSAANEEVGDRTAERRHAASPGQAPGSYGDLDVPVCLPPLAAGVDVRRRPHSRAHLAAIYDIDESGDLDDAELATLQADVALGCALKNAALLADFDVDDDGVLAQDEYDAAREARREAREAARAAADTDGDGNVSRAEHEAAESAILAAWDADGSGDLDDDERAAMRADLQALVRAGADLPLLPGRGARHHHAHHGEDRRPASDDDGADEAESSDDSGDDSGDDSDDGTSG